MKNDDIKTMDQIIPRLVAGLTGTKEQPTKVSPICIKTWESWAGFNTLSDPQLILLLTEVANLLLEIKHKSPPRWLTLAGKSGTGKTMLAKRLYRAVNVSAFFKTSVCGDDFSYPTDFIYWPRMAAALQQGEHPEDMHHAIRCKFLVLDDIGANRDSTGYVTGQLGNLLGERTGRWTVITSNLHMDQISERLDTRVASRLIRDGNRVVDLDCLDYALRSK